MGGGRDAAHTYVISQARVRTRPCALGFVFRSLSLTPLMEGLVNRVIMILQIWLGAMNGRRARAAPTVIHLSFKCGDYHKLCSPPRVLNLKSLPERQSRTRQVELTAVITAPQQRPLLFTSTKTISAEVRLSNDRTPTTPSKHLRKNSLLK